MIGNSTRVERITSRGGLRGMGGGKSDVSFGFIQTKPFWVIENLEVRKVGCDKPANFESTVEGDGIHASRELYKLWIRGARG